MRNLVVSACVMAVLLTAPIAAQEFPLSAADVADSAGLARSMPRLAAEVLAAYRDPDTTRYLDNVFRIQSLAGRYADALASLSRLQARLVDATPRRRAMYVPYRIHLQAQTRAGGAPMAAFAESFRETFGSLDDRTAIWAARALLLSPRTVAGDLRWATPDQTGRSTVSLADALTLLHVYHAVDAYRAFAELPAALVAEDDVRRYLVESNIAVRVQSGATVCAIVARPRRGGVERLPALLQFTIYADSMNSTRDALFAAAHGYAGVTGFTRGKACSPDRTVPYQHDGADAAGLIDWIAAQPWSDGSVGMFGGSYSGFTAWAAAKHMPTALKAIMVGAPVAPGIDVPMEGNVFLNFVYPWPFYTTSTRWLDNATYNDNARWYRLYREWYRTGRPHRDLPAIDGTPNPGFAEWVAHPTVDAWWRATIPEERDYAAIGIPVLQTAGYFFGGPGGALHYFQQHYRHNPRANHYLVIGPWDHIQAQRGVVTALGDTATWIAGYEIDPVARIDLVADLRYQWFDWTMRGGPRPALLADRVNYQVMGANRWGHAPSLAAMANDRLRLYLNAARSGGRYVLSAAPGASGTAIVHTVNLADRADTNAGFVGGLQADVMDTANAIVLVGEPLTDSLEVNGLLSGRLELVANKRDFDLSITPYELTAEGQYYQLAPFLIRASHAGSLSERRLLVPGKPERLEFVSGLRMVSRRLAAGSRLVLVIAVPKGAGQQINYGSGKDVSGESIADAAEPLVIRWLPGSYVELPVRRW